MILIEFLLAPTAPAAPRPKNIARWVSFASLTKCSSHGRLVPLTSASMPMVKWFFGRSWARLLKRAVAIPGPRVNGPIQPPLEPPALPPAGVQGADDFFQHLGGRTHDDHDALGIRR